VLSVCDYHTAYADDATVIDLANQGLITDKLDAAVANWGKSPSLGFFGGDERLGDYFMLPDIDEAERAYQMLILQAVSEFALTAAAIPELAPLAANYTKIAGELVASLRARGAQWHATYGMFACAFAINAGFLTAQETADMLEREFADPVQLVAFTPFNQFFVVKALFAANQTELALQVQHSPEPRHEF
jgi:alpha-L-rhamnosidase